MDHQGRAHDLPAGRGDGTPPVGQQNPRRRRLSDKLLVAFHQACDQGELDVAAELLRILEVVVARPAPSVVRDRRQAVENLVAAHRRLWELRHPEFRHAD